MPRTDWWAHARLYLTAVPGVSSSIRIADGSLAELVTAALQLPEAQHPRAVIQLDRTGRQLPWATIVALSARSDFPVFI